MILPVFIIILMTGGVLAWIAERWNVMFARWISVIVLLFNFVVGLSLWHEESHVMDVSQSSWLEK